MKFDSYTSFAGKSHPAFTSPFEDDDAAAVALNSTDPQAGTFAGDLVSLWSRGLELSDAKRYWLHRLAADVVTPRQPDAFVPVIAEKLTGATEGKNALKRPKIVFGLGDRQVKIQLSTQGRYEGKFVVASRVFGEGFFGSIDSEGNFQATRSCDERIFSLLDELNSDFEAAVVRHGLATGECACCGRELTKQVSIDAGIGPVCAKRFGIDQKALAEQHREQVAVAEVSSEAEAAQLDYEGRCEGLDCCRA